MKFQIGSFVLDTHARVLLNGDKQLKVRPKTLSLLLYLARRPGQIISKQELLEQIWDDVNVDDGVVFQSIREIRQLFDDNSIIQNHPRKGYEFTAPFSPVSEPAQAPKRFGMATRLSGIAIACFALMAYLLFLSPSQDVQYRERILVLPIKNQVSYGEHQWVYLGGMEQLIAHLQGLAHDNYLYPGTQVPRLMHASNAARHYTQTDINKMFAVSGASLIVESELLGNTSDYKLVYTLHTKQDTREGVILDPSVNNALATLSQTIAAFIDTTLEPSDSAPQKEFSDALFAKAMISYESDWQTSVSFFQSYLALNPDSVIAHIYLSKLYLWQNNLDEAAKTIDRASSLTIGFPHDLAHIRLIQGRVAAKQGEFALAHRHFALAQDIASPLNRWFLNASIAEQQGLTFLMQDNAEQAIKAFHQALTHYQITQSLIGIHATRLHLSQALAAQGKQDEADAQFTLAAEGIREGELDFLYGMLEAHSKDLPDKGNNP